jgi:hypothetical protein
MIDANALTGVIVTAIVILSLVAIVAAARELITGSYKQYAAKRAFHVEQLGRVEQVLKKDENHE